MTMKPVKKSAPRVAPKPVEIKPDENTIEVKVVMKDKVANTCSCGKAIADDETLCRACQVKLDSAPMDM